MIQAQGVPCILSRLLVMYPTVLEFAKLRANQLPKYTQTVENTTVSMNEGNLIRFV